MDMRELENRLEQLETKWPAMLDAILRTNLQNQALLRAIIHNQALEANDSLPNLDIDQFKLESTEYADEWLKKISVDVPEGL